MPVYDSGVTTGSPRARYQLAADELRSRITSGRWPVGHRLPGKRDLADELGIAVGTLERAFDVLAAEGLIQPVPGAGTYVIASEPLRRLTVEQRLADLEAWRQAHERGHG